MTAENENGLATTQKPGPRSWFGRFIGEAIIAGLVLIFALLLSRLVAEPPASAFVSVFDLPWIAILPGLLLGALVLSPEKHWGALLIGYVAASALLILLAEGLTDLERGEAGLQAVIEVIGVLFVLYVIKRIDGDGDPFATVTRVLLFVAAVAGAALGGLLIGAWEVAVAPPGPHPLAPLFEAWQPWALAYGCGLLIVGGSLMACRGFSAVRFRLSVRPHSLETLTMGILFGAVAIGLSGFSQGAFPIAASLLVCGPMVMWIALRLSLAVGLLALLILGFIAAASLEGDRGLLLDRVFTSLNDAGLPGGTGEAVRTGFQLLMLALAVSLMLAAGATREVFYKLQEKQRLRRLYR